MKFLDTNIIAYAFYYNQHTLNCQKIIKEGNTLTNTFALAEAFEIIRRETNQEIAEKSLITILRYNIEVVEIDVKIFYDVIKKIKNHNLKIYDMIHYICALQNECESIVSYDTDFDNLDIPREEP